jgi:hypothetical protein
MSKREMILSGDGNIPAMPVSNSNVNHLRRMLAWFRCEYMLDEDMQRGFLSSASECVRLDSSLAGRASEIVQQKADQINQVPAYVRQAVKMLTKAIREHDKQSGIVDLPSEQGEKNDA